jgi:hypothetical protein
MLGLRVLWLVVATAVPLAGSWAVAVRLFGHRGVFDRLLFWLLCFVGSIVVTFQLAELAQPFSSTSLFLVSAGLSVGAFAWAIERVHPRDLWRVLKADLSAPRRLVLDAVSTKEPAVLLIPFALLGLVWSVWMVLFFRSWGWDVLMFHTTITNKIAQAGSIGWIDTAFHQARGYPRNVHLLAVWNVLFLGNTELDDAPQLPFGLIGALATAAWARRVGATRSFSTGLGAAWLCFPAVILQLPSVHVDTACGALLAAGAYFAANTEERCDQLGAATAFGLYLGTKHTGLFHLGLYAPILLLPLLRELRASTARLRVIGAAFGLGALVLLLGAHKYVQNAVVAGNPAWPFKLSLPVLGTLPYENDPSTQYGGPPGGRASFFGIPGELENFLGQLRKWDVQVYWPDVRDGYFGLTFTALLLPSFLLAFVALRHRALRWQPFGALFLFGAAISVPSAYWPRYSMSASVAGLVAFALAWVAIDVAVVRKLLSTALVALTAYMGWIVVTKLRTDPQYGWPSQLVNAAGWTPFERATQQVASWNWPREALELKEREFQPGDVITFDQYFTFPGELFTRDLRNQVVYVETNANQLPERIKATGARFSIVTAGAAGVLQQAGAVPRLPINNQWWLLEWKK